MGGDIKVESVEGEGSTFIVTIITQPARGPLQPYMLRNVSEFEDKSVLLIGGFLPYQESLSLLLQRWGLRTISQTGLGRSPVRAAGRIGI